MNIKIARRLDEAANYATAIPQISKENQLSLSQAYDIQRMSMARRYSRGEKSIGIKLGFTSRAKMEQMGVSDMIWGWLTDDMFYPAGGTLPLSKYIHPRAEPEICFITSKVIDRKLEMNELTTFVSGLTVAIEVIDSRYENFKFSLEDVIADNCSSAGLIVGEMLPVDTNLKAETIQLIINGEVRQTGSTDDILGNPWESVMEASRLISEAGLSLPAGSLIMAGAATAAEFLKKGDEVKALLGNDVSEVTFFAR